MNLQSQQSIFVKNLALLINYIYSLGYELTLGDTYPGKYKHTKNSFHEKGLAIDLNLFKDGIFLKDTLAHNRFGLFWEFLGGTWGGRWNDGNHYSWCESKDGKINLQSNEQTTHSLKD